MPRATYDSAVDEARMFHVVGTMADYRLLDALKASDFSPRHIRDQKISVSTDVLGSNFCGQTALIIPGSGHDFRAC